VKFVRPELASSEHGRSSLEREARALCALGHPNVCTVHDLVAQFSLGDYRKANAYFRDAITIDPNYALAYAGPAMSDVDGLPTATMVKAKAAEPPGLTTADRRTPMPLSVHFVQLWRVRM